MAEFIRREAAIEAAKAHYPKVNEMIAGIILIPVADVRKPRLRRCGLCKNEHVRLEQSPNGFWHVVCDRYACDRKVDHYYNDPEEAVYRWNTSNYILK